jgi:hypothetical protein
MLNRIQLIVLVKDFRCFQAFTVRLVAISSSSRSLADLDAD